MANSRPAVIAFVLVVAACGGDDSGGLPDGRPVDAPERECEVSADCADTEPCNGAETCGAAHACEAGTALADGTACTTGTIPDGACRGGACVSVDCGNSLVDPGEACDDGMNGDDADGCRDDCTFTCTAAADCDDSNPCNGVESCLVDHRCEAGTPPTCSDGNACTQDLCDAATGCTNPIIDGDGDGFPPSSIAGCGTDCNDANPAINPGAAEVTADGADQNCDGAEVCYVDLDDDGWRTNATVGSADADCDDPGEALATEPGVDCNDASPAVNPGAAEVCFNGADDNCAGGQDEAAECSIDCNWTGARWLSHGWDGASSTGTGAYLTCTAGKLAFAQFVNNAGVAVSPPVQGTGDPTVGCNWGATTRWVSQGFDGSAAFSNGARVACSGSRITSMNWETNGLPTGTTMSGQLGCNWSGAIFLSHGIDGACAFQTGVNVSCSNSHITHMESVVGAGCPFVRN